MTKRNELLEAAFEFFPDGVAVLGSNQQLVYWNRAAESITGFAAAEILTRHLPDAIESLVQVPVGCVDTSQSPDYGCSRGSLIHALHKFGNPITVLARTIVLRDEMGTPIGTGHFFHAAEGLDNLPHGDTGYSESVEASQSDTEERLLTAHTDLEQTGRPFGILWITVDQARDLRRTHGSGACDAMLNKIHRTLINGLKPEEEIGRWGQDEFLVLSHEQSAEMLASHAQSLAGLSRTTDFRWWGDRLSLTVSIGAAQAVHAEPLAELLERAQLAMNASVYAGGNHITLVPRRPTCSPS